MTTIQNDTPSWWSRVVTFEPALLRGILAALAIVLGSFGVDATNVFEQVNVAWVAVFGVIPLVQAWWTRQAVVPLAKADDEVDQDFLVDADADEEPVNNDDEGDL